MADLNSLNLNKQLYRESVSTEWDFYTPESLSGVVSSWSSTDGWSLVDGWRETSPESLTSGELLWDLIMVDGFIRSKNYVATVSGWTINADGSVEFDNGYFRWDITGASGTFSWTLTGGSLNIPDTTTASSFHVDASGNAWWGTNIATGYATAPVRILSSGSIYATDGSFSGTLTIGGRLATIIGGAINADGDYINDLINARINTDVKTILSDFNFGTTDYAGAVKSGDITWNTTTGTITGGSGVVVYRGGIIGAKSGVETFSISASTGDATFAGTLSAPSGTLGTITAGTITGATIQTASSGQRIVMDTTRLRGIDSNDRSYFDLYNPSDASISLYSHGQQSCFRSFCEPLNSVFSTYPASYFKLIPHNNEGSTKAIGSDATVATFSSLYPLVYGNATKTGTGTINLSSFSSYDLLASGETFQYYGYNYSSSAKQYKIEIDGVGSPNTFKWSDDGGSTWIATGVSIAGGLTTLTSSDNSYIKIIFSSTTGGVSGDYWEFTAGATSSSAESVLDIIQEKSFATGNVIDLTNNGSGFNLSIDTTTFVSTNFKKGIKVNGISIWTSNGTTPNGNLSGTTGDICINCDSGKTYYCTGTTNWTAM